MKRYLKSITPLLNSNRWIFLLLLLVAAIPRIILLDQKSLWSDEAATRTMALMPVKDLLDFMPGYDTHGPVYALLPKLFFHQSTSSIFLFRLPYAICGAFCVPFCFLLLNEFYRRKSALIGSLIMAFSPLYLQLSQEGRLYPILLLTFLMSTWVLVLFLKRRIRTVYFIIFYLLTSVVGVYTDVIPQASIFFFHWLIGLYFSINRIYFLFLLLLQVVCGVLFVPYALLYFTDASNFGYEMHLSGQSSRIFSSPISQLMMFLSSLFRALNYLIFPAIDYFHVLGETVGAEKRVAAWSTFLFSCFILGYWLSKLSTSDYAFTIQRRIMLSALALILFCISAYPILINSYRAWQFFSTFLFALAFVLTLVFFEIDRTWPSISDKRLVILALCSIPMLYGAKLLVPMDPRHFSIPFVLILGMMGNAVFELWIFHIGRLLAGVVIIGLFSGIGHYFTSNTEIYHPQDFRQAGKRIHALEISDETILMNASDWGAKEALKYYLFQLNPESGVLKQIDEIPLHQKDSDLLPVIEAQLKHKDKVHILSLHRLDSEYFAFFNQLILMYHISVQECGREIIFITVSGKIH